MWHFSFIDGSRWQSFSAEGNRVVNEALSQEAPPTSVTWSEIRGIYNDAVCHLDFDTMLLSVWLKSLGCHEAVRRVTGMWQDRENPYDCRTFNYEATRQMAIYRYRICRNLRDLSLIHI